MTKGLREPVAIVTMLGWVLSSAMDKPRKDTPVNIVTEHVMEVQNIPFDEGLTQQLKQCWNLKSIGIESNTKVSDNDIVHEFRKSIKFDGYNYFVRLPWKPEFGGIPDNYSVTRGRLYSLFSRLRKTPSVLKEHDNIIKGQVEEGIVENVDEEKFTNVRGVYYIPHREVVREKPETTKLRIVYNAGSKLGGPSLNDCLETGHCLLPKIFDILVRFRAYKYGITSDIKSAFLNIRVQEIDRDF